MANNIIRFILRSVVILIELIYLPIRFFWLFKQPKKCSPINNHILLLRAEELAEKIREQEISSEAVVKAYISRINDVNPIINAVIENRFEAALEDARKVDSLIKEWKFSKGELKDKYPLLGVPITIKGSIALEGVLHCGGRPDRLITAKEDAVCVKYVKNAGAIPLLVSNVPELCLNLETTNKLIGRTNNPYNSTRTAGGSSGGEASLIAGGASIFGIGSDIGGSIRLPAHYCGIWGHKPSPNTVSTVGHYPDCKNRNEWNSVFTLGPLTRYATDLKFLLNIIVEKDKKEYLKLKEKVDVRKLKFYYIHDIDLSLGSKVDESCVEAIDKIVNYFDSIGDNKCKKINLPSMKYSFEMSFLRLSFIDGVENLFDEKGQGAYSELFRFFACNSIHEFTSILYGLIRRNIGRVPDKTIIDVKQYLNKLKNDLMAILKNDGVLILPCSPSEAFFHGDEYRKAFNLGYTAIFNMLGFPTTTCPILLSKNNLPIGVQVVAGPNLDYLTLSVAEELERKFGGWNHKVFE